MSTAKKAVVRQGFKTGEHVVYPSHGVGQITAIEEQEVAGFKLELFVVSFAKDKMTQGDADALTSIIERKATATSRLAPLSAARNALLEKTGLSRDRSGMEAWLRQHPGNVAVRDRWQRLLELAAEAQELNRLNGELIHLRMGHNAQMLEALRAANRQDLYGADGQATLGTPRRVIDSA